MTLGQGGRRHNGKRWGGEGWGGVGWSDLPSFSERITKAINRVKEAIRQDLSGMQRPYHVACDLGNFEKLAICIVRRSGVHMGIINSYTSFQFCSILLDITNLIA